MGRLHAGMATVPAPEPEKSTPEIEYVRWLQQMQTDLTATLGGVMLRGARPVQIGTAQGGTLRPSTSPGRLVGWSVRIPALGALPGVLKLHDGQDANGDVIAVINLPPGGSDTKHFGGGGISFQYGLFVEIVTGGVETAIEGAVYLGVGE